MSDLASRAILLERCGNCCARRMPMKLRFCVLALIALLILGGCNKPGTVSVQRQGGKAVVVGGIYPCEGIPIKGGPRYAAGTVTVLRGWLTRKSLGRGNYDDVFPAQLAGQETVRTNATYRFVLAPGHYILRARIRGNAYPFAQVTVRARTVSHLDIPNMCM